MEAALIKTPLAWEYKKPACTTNLMKILIFLEPVNQWKDVYIMGKSITSNGKMSTNVHDLKCTILAGFASISIDKDYEF
eukprot:3179898-Pyramimonas_sp.AAC.1